MVARHEVLRTVYPEVDGAPYQCILGRHAVRPTIDRVSVTPCGLESVLVAEARRGFDLRRDLPLRGVLYAVGEGEHVLLLVLHHIAGDGWSLGPLMRDLAQAYAARCAGVEPGWAPPAVQYADYAVWQRELLGSEEDPGSRASQQLEYWTTALRGLPDQLALPFDHPRPPVA
ncbi:condensation domain-containing protein, partial [Streptomyces oceani]|uniref:condensation domain-containing protein n=1 Tax=Streptomyces oceani TaxID=1075402 RepID=UPI0030B84101